MNESDRLFSRGNRNPEYFGFSLRATLGAESDRDAIERAALMLSRDPFYIDKQGYQYDLIAAAIHAPSGRLAYVQSCARKRWWSSMVYISIKIHLRDTGGNDSSVDIKSYNPFFGCDVGFFEWLDDTALLIYTEKHDTYVCAFGPTWPPRFVEIEERWMIKDGVLGYVGYKDVVVRRLAVPSLAALESLPLNEAERIGILPPDP